MTRLTTIHDQEGVAERAAREAAGHLAQAQRERGVAHLALSGGNTPRRTYELLAEQFEGWESVEVWFVDERCVPPEDDQSNYKLAKETLLDPAKIAAEQVHRMEGELGPEVGARRYREQLEAHLPRAGGSGGSGGEQDLPVLDLAILGIGPDGHVASLFPGASTLEARPQELCLGVTESPKPPPERLTLNLGMLHATRRCLLVVIGASKADALSAAIGEQTPHVPASLLRRERLTILADDAASPPAPIR